MSGPDPWHHFGGGVDTDAAGDRTDAGPTYNPRTDTYIDTFDDAPASIAVAEALAAIKHCDPIDLPPLYRSVDPDALDNLVASGDSDLRVRIDIEGFEIVVIGDGRLELTPPSA